TTSAGGSGRSTGSRSSSNPARSGRSSTASSPGAPTSAGATARPPARRATRRPDAGPGAPGPAQPGSIRPAALRAVLVEEPAHVLRRGVDPLDHLRALRGVERLAATPEEIGEAEDDRERRAEVVD